MGAEDEEESLVKSQSRRLNYARNLRSETCMTSPTTTITVATKNRVTFYEKRLKNPSTE